MPAAPRRSPHEERFGVIELDVSKRLLQPQAVDGNDDTEAKQ